jgi:hypothetical protein|tara:strand:+ start:165 stop:464 length:300 start_codon:yes stop_codon:yes gene_type:complete
MYDYDSHPKAKMTKEESDIMLKKFLDKGGKVEKLSAGYPINVGSMHKSGKPDFSREEIKKGIKGKAPRPNYNTDKPGQVACGDRPPVWEYQPPNKMAGK